MKKFVRFLFITGQFYTSKLGYQFDIVINEIGAYENNSGYEGRDI